LYPTDDAPFPAEARASHKQKLSDVMQEALATHVKGLRFRERHAGPTIDEHMRDHGFDIEIGVDLNTGFVCGGNAYNCGTWCDKMGSSERAGTRGEPATPRDGSAIELVGLTRFVLEFLIKASSSSSSSDEQYPYNGVWLEKEKREFTWVEWAQKMDANFEKHFWIDENSDESTHINKVNNKY
jgi:glycogen debranching enzyme